MSGEEESVLNMLVQAVATLSADVAVIRQRAESVLEGFPDADAESHRKYHEALIRAAEERHKLYLELRAHLLKTGVWAAIVGTGVVLWTLAINYLKTQLKG